MSFLRAIQTGKSVHIENDQDGRFSFYASRLTNEEVEYLDTCIDQIIDGLLELRDKRMRI